MKALTPYQIGQRAFAMGAPLSRNPFDTKQNLRAWVQWSYGWTDAEEARQAA